MNGAQNQRPVSATFIHTLTRKYTRINIALKIINTIIDSKAQLTVCSFVYLNHRAARVLANVSKTETGLAVLLLGS